MDLWFNRMLLPALLVLHNKKSYLQSLQFFVNHSLYKSLYEKWNLKFCSWNFLFLSKKLAKIILLLFFLLGNSDIGSDARLLFIFAMFIFLFSLGFCFYIPLFQLSKPYIFYAISYFWLFFKDEDRWWWWRQIVDR